MFFPKVYPDKDQYVLLLENAIKGGGATTFQVEFSDPSVGQVLLTNEEKRFMLPAYPLLDSAKIINSAYPKENKINTDSALFGNKKVEKKNNDDKTLKPDSILRLPATVSFKGNYAQIRAVIKNLESLKRALVIKESTIQKDKDSLMATLIIDFYAVEKVDNGEDVFNSWTVQGSYGKADPFS
jgi:hypothetical protein